MNEIIIVIPLSLLAKSKKKEKERERRRMLQSKFLIVGSLHIASLELTRKTNFCFHQWSFYYVNTTKASRWNDEDSPLSRCHIWVDKWKRAIMKLCMEMIRIDFTSFSRVELFIDVDEEENYSSGIMIKFSTLTSATAVAESERRSNGETCEILLNG